MKRFLTTAALTCGLVGVAALARADDALVKRGMTLYATEKCALCHTIAGVGKRTALDGVGSKLSVEQIREWLVDPKSAAAKAKSTAKPVMKDYSKLPKDDIEALVAYMKSLTK